MLGYLFRGCQVTLNSYTSTIFPRYGAATARAVDSITRMRRGFQKTLNRFTWFNGGGGGGGGLIDTCSCLWRGMASRQGHHFFQSQAAFLHQT